MDLNLILGPILFLLVFLVIFLLFWSVIESRRSKGRITRSLNLILFSVSLPREEKKEKEGQLKPIKEIISTMEQFYASLDGLREKGLKAILYGQPYLVLELAVPHIGEEISFYLAAPRRYAGAVEKAIHGFYPKAIVEETNDYNIFNPEGATAGAVLRLTKSYIFSFKTYQNLAVDPLNEITNSLSKLEERGEGAVMQILIRPAKHGWQDYGLKIAREVREGKTYEAARIKMGRSSFEKAFGEVSEIISPSSLKKGEAPKEQKSQILQEEFIKTIESKASKVGFETNIRFLTSAATGARAEQILNHLESSFSQFVSPNFNSFKIKQLKGGQLQKLVFNFSFRIFDNKEVMLLDTEELTSLYHFPTVKLETPKIKFVKAKFAAPPANLSKEGLILGRNIYRGEETLVRLAKDDRRRHLYIIGQTGTGKSVLLQGMIKQDIEAGEGLGVLDPHGDLIEAALELIPKERVEDVVLCDPMNLERPFGLNMLEYDPSKPEQKTFIVNELINIFDKLYDLRVSGGPMFEQYTRNALLLLMDDPNEPVTLMEVPRVMANKEYRSYLLAKCKNIVVKDFWEKEAEKAGGEAALANMVPYITSKFNVFIANDYMRPIIGQVKSSFNFRDIMDNRKILLVNLSKGRLGDINSSLLGLIFTGKLLIASLGRIDIPQEERKDFYLYIDEFQNFITESISVTLAEARKYRLNLIAAHQFIKQLSEKISSAVFGNVGSKACFRIGVEDAPVMVKEFEPVFDENDLVNIDNFNAYLKILINGQTSLPFNIQTFPPSRGNPEMAKAIKELSSLKYGRDREEIEAEIVNRRMI